MKKQYELWNAGQWLKETPADHIMSDYCQSIFIIGGKCAECGASVIRPGAHKKGDNHV